MGRLTLWQVEVRPGDREGAPQASAFRAGQPARRCGGVGMASAGTGVGGGHFSFYCLYTVNGRPCSGWAHSPAAAGGGHGSSQPWDLTSHCVKLRLSETLAALSPTLLSPLLSTSCLPPSLVSRRPWGQGPSTHRKQAQSGQRTHPKTRQAGGRDGIPATASHPHLVDGIPRPRWGRGDLRPRPLPTEDKAGQGEGDWAGGGASGSVGP